MRYEISAMKTVVVASRRSGPVLVLVDADRKQWAWVGSSSLKGLTGLPDMR